MKADPVVIHELENAFNPMPGNDPLEVLSRVQILSIRHGPEQVVAALAQLHLVAATQLRFVRRGEALVGG